MGKRKTQRKPMKRKSHLAPLDTEFDCPFCGRQNTCEVFLDKSKNIGKIRCKVCLEDFQCKIHRLSREIDVYSEWIDACESVNP